MNDILKAKRILNNYKELIRNNDETIVKNTEFYLNNINEIERFLKDCYEEENTYFKICCKVNITLFLKNDKTIFEKIAKKYCAILCNHHLSKSSKRLLLIYKLQKETEIVKTRLNQYKYIRNEK